MKMTIPYNITGKQRKQLAEDISVALHTIPKGSVFQKGAEFGLRTFWKKCKFQVIAPKGQRVLAQGVASLALGWDFATCSPPLLPNDPIRNPLWVFWSKNQRFLNRTKN